MEEKGHGEHTFALSWEDLDGEFPYMIHLNPKAPACPSPHLTTLDRDFT